MFFGRNRWILGVLLICGWLPSIYANDSDQMYIKASALTKLATAVEATVFRETPAELSDGALLEVASKHDPDLLVPFGGHVLRATRHGNHTSVLLCTSDGSQRLIEDAGCTAKVDRHYWRDGDSTGCDFGLKLESICQ